MIDLKFKLGRKEISQIFIYHLTLRNIRFRFLMFFPQKSQETSLSLLYLCHNYIDCCSILLTILLYHCFRHLWFSIRQLRRQLYSQNKSQDAKSLRCLKLLFQKAKSLCFDHRSILVQKVTVFLKGYWHHNLKRRQYRNGESNINQFMIFVLCTQKQLFYEWKIMYVHNTIHKKVPPPAANCHFLSSYPRCRRKDVIFD